MLIDRSTKWGNPFTHIRNRNTRASFVVGSRDQAISSYETWVLGQGHLMAALPELRDKILGCWCRPLSCHGDVLVRLANT